ncbi:hypothetical protein FD12_GL001039 [Lentilactobacillus rapi DSM 19907 = JCM 15042]|nr:hypothetical protein FD12_GL001039 [Lentilactobacillus rapi DSM 19907 = JCM 15042]
MANSQPASAKTYARVTSNSKMAMLPQDRNVTFTGDNALYTKAGTLKGARVVASKATLSSFSNVSSSTHNVRAYRIATTNRGSIYYKVVTYDGSYRGWIYGGKTDSDFNGGVQQYRTFTNQAFSTLTSAQQNGTYKITTPGTANDGTQVTYKSPAYTNYKVGRAITDSSPYANTQFRIDAVGYRTKEGSSDQWVHIYDPANPNSQATGWIKMSGLTQMNATTPIADNQIQFNIMDPNNSNNTLVSFNWTKAGATRNSYLGNYNTTTHNWSLDSNDQASLQTAINNALSGYNSTHGTNYSYNISNLTQSQLNNLAVAQFGGSVKLYLNSNIADNALRINLVEPNGTTLKSTDWYRSGATRGSNVGYSQSNSSYWTLNASDINSITSQINQQLSGTGYQLSGNSLSTSQIDTIARGNFGGQVNIGIVSANQVTSTIVPMADNQPLSQFRPASDNTNAYDTTNVDFPKGTSSSSSADTKLAAIDLGKMSNADQKALADYIGGAYGTPELNKLNSDFESAAEGQYVYGENQDWTYGPGTSGSSFSSNAIVNQIKANNGMGTLYSPVFPQIEPDSSTNPASFKLVWYHTPFTFSNNANSGTFGTNVSAFYSKIAKETATIK